MTHKPYHIYYTDYLTFYRKTSSIPVYILNEMLTLSVLLFFLLVSAGSNWYTGAASILGATGVENWESKHPQYKLILNACFLPGAGTADWHLQGQSPLGLLPPENGPPAFNWSADAGQAPSSAKWQEDLAV